MAQEIESIDAHIEKAALRYYEGLCDLPRFSRCTQPGARTHLGYVMPSTNRKPSAAKRKGTPKSPCVTGLP